MMIVSLALCGVVAMLTMNYVPQTPEDGSAEQTTEIILQPNTEDIVPETRESIGFVRSDVQDTLTASSEYGTIFPYPAKVIGWKEDGTPIFRYAMADSGGQQITNAVYQSITRQICGGQAVWVMQREENGENRVSCAARDGSWTLGPYDGSITIYGDKIFVRRTENAAVTTVYNNKGKILGQIAGIPAACDDGVIVSYVRSEDQTAWNFYDAGSLNQTGTVEAVSVGTFSDGHAVVQIKENVWGFTDAEGNVVKTDAVQLEDCLEGCSLAKNKDGKYGVLNTNGEEIIPFDYIKAAACSEEVALYQLWESEKKCVVIHATDGQKLSLPSDLNAQQLTPLPKNYFAYSNEKEQKTIVFDDLASIDFELNTKFYRQGKKVLVAASEDSYRILSLEDGEAGKKREYRYVPAQDEASQTDTVFTIEDTETGAQGIANVRGRVVLSPVYDSIRSVDGSYYEAVQDCWAGIVDSNGEWIIRTRLTGME